MHCVVRFCDWGSIRLVGERGLRNRWGDVIGASCRVLGYLDKGLRRRREKDGEVLGSVVDETKDHDPSWSLARGPAVNGVLSVLTRLTSNCPLLQVHHFGRKVKRNSIAVLLLKGFFRGEHDKAGRRKTRLPLGDGRTGFPPVQGLE